MGWRAALATGVTLIALVSATASAIFLLSPSNQASASFIRAQPGSIAWNDKQPLTVLFLGLDSKLTATEGLAVGRYNPSRNTLNIVSIPPSLWVTIPGFGQGRIADAYADGGPRLALLTVESVTRLAIPYYVSLDPSTFRQLVDSYGGLALPSSETRRPRANGEAVLAYMAGGPAGRDGESERMQRDAVVARALRSAAVRPVSLLQIVSIINTLGGGIRTNFPYNQIPPLVRRLARTPIEWTALDESSGAVSQYRSSSGPVLLPDWQRMSVVIGSLLPAPSAIHGSVKILNGSGVVGQAAALASWLRGMKIRVSGAGSASSFNHGQTLVILNSRSRQRAYALAHLLSAILQAPIVTRPVQGSATPVAVIIGRDYQDLTQQ
jgi:anionic cell wall polymer biosynthesis LytR-Cps2A-Psr (LCP) family protein